MTQSNIEEPFTRCSHFPRCRGGKSRQYPPLLIGNGSCKDPDPQKKESPEVHTVLRAKGGLLELKAQGGCNRDPYDNNVAQRQSAQDNIFQSPTRIPQKTFK